MRMRTKLAVVSLALLAFSTVSFAAETETIIDRNNPNGGNCVSFVRSKISSTLLNKTDLTYLSAKLTLIDSEVPLPGTAWKSAVIMNGNSVNGHIAIFTGFSCKTIKVKGKDQPQCSLSVQDANWREAVIKNRTYTNVSLEAIKKEAGIRGFHTKNVSSK